MLGITLRLQAWNCEVGSHITAARHPITEGIRNKSLGVRERLNPSYYVDDENPGVVPLGEYLQTGLVSVAARQMEGWRSVFCGEPTLTAEFFRGLCRYAGVHLYATSGEDYLYVEDGWLTIHATRDGTRTLYLPQPSGLYDLNEGRLLGEGLREYSASLRARTTYCFYIGSLDEMRKLGMSGVERTRRGRQRSQPILTEAPPEKESAEPEAPAMEESAVPEIETAAAGEDGEETAFEAEETAAEASERRRRRRRRGGRGRGQRRAPGAEGSGEAGGDGAQAAGD
jgi:hypothetical protein